MTQSEQSLPRVLVVDDEAVVAGGANVGFAIVGRRRECHATPIH